MGMDKKDIYQKIANKELTVEEGKRLIQNLKETEEKSPNLASDNTIIKKLIDMLATAIKKPTSEIKIRVGFYEQGLDSNDLLQFVKELEKELDEELYPTLLFEYTTIESLADFIAQEYPGKLNVSSIKDMNSSIKQKENTISKEERVDKLSTKTSNIKKDDIAIIGLSGRYPQANDIYQLWDNLKEGRDSVTEIPEERWDYHKYFNPDKNSKGTIYSKWGGFIDDVDKFDPLFFNISPREATVMDPQERIFLEECWKVIEDAGYKRENLGTDKVGVFTATTYGDYQLFDTDNSLAEKPRAIIASIANRVSYFFNFNGPSLTLDTMCSSSLTTVHMASKSIQHGECELAIAGGINLSIHPNKYLNLSQGKFLASDGRCRSFGKGGDGFVPGEGVGAILLKPLSKAIKDNDHIYAIIKGSAINHGGKASGMTVPNPNAQAQLIIDAIEDSQIDPATISYVEAHGTGTSLGDPIEITGLTKAYKNYTELKQYCSIGSIKSNIGHLEAAAGMSGIAKLLLQLKYKMLVPSIHSDELNPNINFKDSPFYVQHKLEEWKKPIINNKEYPRRAGISGFGAGGSNAHIIFEEYEGKIIQTDNDTPTEYLIAISAKDIESLRDNALNIASFISSRSDNVRLEDIAFTLTHGREEMKYRIAFTASSKKQIIDVLEKYSQKIKITNNDFTYGTVNEKENVESIDIKRYYEKNELNKIAKLWCEGNKINWSVIYNNQKVPRVSLPTYSFLKERYWLNNTEDNNTHMYQLNWRKVELSKPSPMNIIQSLLIFDYDRTFFSKLKKQQKKTNIVLVIFGKEYSIKDNIYTIRYNNSNDYEKLFKELTSKNIIRNILHFGSRKHNCFDIDHINEMFDIGIASIFYIIKSINKLQLTYKVKIDYVINDSKVNPIFEAVAGYSKSIQLAVPNIIIHTIKLSSINENFQNIIKELNNYSLEESEIYYNTNHDRFIRTLEPITSSMDIIEESKLKKRGTYLITGGLGGLGYIFSKYLKEKYQANLVLTGRSKLNSEKKIKLNSLNKNKEQAIYIQADITDYNDMIKVVNESEKRFGTLDFIIHSAGVTDYNTVIEKNIIDLKKLLKSKIDGTIVLWKIMKSKNINNLILFSSTSSVLGDFGQCNYSIGNKFLDSFGSYLNEISPHNIKVINWPLWREGGMHGNKDAEELYLKTAGLTYLETKKGQELFDKIVNSDRAHVIIFSGNKANIKKILKTNSIEKQNTNEITTKIIKNDTPVDLTIKKHISDILKLPIEKIEKNTKLVELGFDSISLTEFAKRISLSLNQQISTTLFFDYPSIQELIDYVGKKNNQLTHSTDSLKSELKKIVNNILQIDKNKIDSTENIANFGFDSVTLTDFTKQLEVKFNTKITPTLFFEYSTIDSLAQYFLNKNTKKPKNMEKKQSNLNKIQIVGVSKKYIKPTKKQKYWSKPIILEELNKQNLTLQNDSLVELLEENKTIRLLVTLSEDCKIEVTISGSGSPILIITGLGQISSGWFRQIKNFRKDNQIIILHNPGQGLSSPIKNVSLDILNNIFNRVVSILNIPKPLPIIGMSLGGLLALYYSHKYPSLFSKLTLISTPYHYDYKNTDYIAAQSIYESAKNDLKKMLENKSDKRLQKNKDKYLKQIVYSDSINPLMSIKYAETILHSTNTMSFLGTIQIPTLIIHGKADNIVSIKEAEIINKNIPNSTFKEIKDAGHFPIITHHKLINRFISDFLKK